MCTFVKSFHYALLSVVLDEKVFQNAHFCFEIFVLVIFFRLETTHY
jgi:hypothetical protein